MSRPGDAKDPDEILIIRTPEGPKRVSRHNYNRIREEQAEEDRLSKRRATAKASKAARKSQRKRQRQGKKRR